MNREKVIELARAAHLDVYGLGKDHEKFVAALEHFGTFIDEGATQVFHQLLNILGPTPPECCGCAYEWQAAIDLIKKELE
jgi:hypothetical protein